MTISADVIQRPDSTYPIIIRPYKLDISQFGDKVRDRMKFTIVNSSDQEVALNLVAALPKYATIDLPKKIGPRQTAGGEVKLLPSVLEESFAKSFTIEVTGETTSRFTVPVKRTTKSSTGDTATQTGAEVAH